MRVWISHLRKASGMSEAFITLDPLRPHFWLGEDKVLQWEDSDFNHGAGLMVSGLPVSL